MRTFQEMFENAKIAIDRINFYSGVIIIDRGQIKQFENMYRELDVYVNSLIPYIPSHFDSLNVQGMIHTMRNLQNKIEDKLIIFYQNLLERDQMKVVFTLPQLRDYSFVEAVNRSVHHLGDSSVSRSVSHSVNESINESTSKSVSSDSSLVQNSSNNFSHIKTSSPKNEGYDIPKFKPHIDKDAQKEKEPVLSNLLRGNRPGNSNGISSKVRAKFNIFLKRKNELEVEVRELMGSFSNEQVQPKTLKLKALDLKSRLTSLNIENWINDDKVCHLDPIELSNWEDRIGKDIATVLYQTEDKINIRKGLAQSGIKKRDPPCFNGSVLDFPLFKKNWSIEVTPVGLPELIELNHLKASVPSSARDRLYEIETLKEAWSILEKIYGKEFDLRNRLGQEFLSIKISAKSSPLIEI